MRRMCTLCGWTQAEQGAGRTLAIASAQSGEGKTSLAVAFAIMMAQDHASDVLLIECDLLRPTIARDFGLVSDTGLTQLLEGQSSRALRSRIPNLWLLPAGEPVDNPSRLLRSPRMSALLEEARSRYAFVILDLPAVLDTSDAAVLARQTDGMVLVVRSGRTDTRAVQQALQVLSGANLHGVVLNRSRTATPDFIRRLFQL